jgi:CRISPR/Cas system-associated exonuclease Cas4 (RecB family)
MQIPDGPNGFPTLSASQFRTYGTGGFLLEFNEEPKGCPRKYHSKYVLKEKYPEEFSYPLVYGGMFHRVMHLMEEPGLTPDEAIAEAFEPEYPQEMWTELREDIDRYMARGSAPSDVYATLAVEVELTALLYTDEEYGPIWYRGFLDWVGLDPENPRVIHSVDYKTNRQPAKRDDLLGDVQLRSYDWLVTECAEEMWGIASPRVVTHLDVVKFNDVDVAYSRADIEDWHSWAVAMARKILRDDTHEPILNTMCASCPIRETCPAFLGMPTLAGELAGVLTKPEGLQDPVKKLEWRDRANSMRLTLEKAVKSIDEEFKSLAEQKGGLRVGDQQWVQKSDWGTVVDIRKLANMLGEDFWKIASVSQTAVKGLIKGWPESTKSQIMALYRKEPAGSKIVRENVENAR